MAATLSDAGIGLNLAPVVDLDVNPQNDTLRLVVRDSGVGIAPEKLPALFEKFTQADNSAPRRFGGTGLGLAICRELAQLMTGEIGVTSELGLGSMRPTQDVLVDLYEWATVLRLEPARRVA